MYPLVSQMRGSVGALALLLCAAAADVHAEAPAPEAEPFRTRNLNPLIAIYGGPGWEVAGRPGSRSLAITLDLASHDWFETAGEHRAALDAETWRAALAYRQEFAGNWAVSVEIPWLRVSGGVLDPVIDRWHRIFGLPHGSRGQRPVGATLLRFSDEGGVFHERHHSGSGPGDVRMAVSRRLTDSDGYSVTVAVKLPTGSRALLAGSGAVDMSVTATRVRQGRFRNLPAAYFWGAGLVAPGSPQVSTFSHRSLVPVAMLGGGWHFSRRLGIKGQLDVHGRYYDSPLAVGQTGVQLTVGGWWSFASGVRFEFGVNEDLTVHTSPDMVLHTAIRWSL